MDGLARHSSVYAIDLVNMGKSQRIGKLDCLAAAVRFLFFWIEIFQTDRTQRVADIR
jgi:hypothetical protein